MTCAADCTSCAELDAIRVKACTCKVAYGPKRARTVADERNRASGQRIYQAYRCPFTDAEHFHVGHSLGWAAVEHLASLLRHRSYPEGPHRVAS